MVRATIGVTYVTGLFRNPCPRTEPGAAQLAPGADDLRGAPRRSAHHSDAKSLGRQMVLKVDEGTLLKLEERYPGIGR
ncbi:MAG: hypothetical protein ACREA0_13225, partial [bacterium]